MQFKIIGYDKEYNDLEAQWIEALTAKLAVAIYIKSHPKAIKAYMHEIR